MGELEQARLIFFIESPEAQLERIIARLALDYSPAEQVVPAMAGGTWYVSTAPVHVEEFPSVVTYLPKIASLFSAAPDVRITPVYLTSAQIVAGATGNDPHGIYIGTGARARLIATASAGAECFELCDEHEPFSTELLAFVNTKLKPLKPW
ncbi:MAG: hypothetical protein ACR2IE_12040 [Candidatus Sumerlaeaceae bacterium]